jgi:hypothetical protein
MLASIGSLNKNEAVPKITEQQEFEGFLALRTNFQFEQGWPAANSSA